MYKNWRFSRNLFTECHFYGLTVEANILWLNSLIFSCWKMIQEVLWMKLSFFHWNLCHSDAGRQLLHFDWSLVKFYIVARQYTNRYRNMIIVTYYTVCASHVRVLHLFHLFLAKLEILLLLTLVRRNFWQIKNFFFFFKFLNCRINWVHFMATKCSSC